MPDKSTAKSALATGIALRRAVGWLGILLPFALVFGCAFMGATGLGPICEDRCIRVSMSDYHHTEVRGIFVGTLFIVGSFLLAYVGHELEGDDRISDSRLADFMGVSAICVALFPSKHELFAWVPTIHVVAAACMFGAMAYMTLRRFTRTRHGGRAKVYRFAALMILLAMLLMGIVSLCASRGQAWAIALDKGPWLLFWEGFGLAWFGIAWLVKGQGVPVFKKTLCD